MCGIIGSVVECSPATRAARVRFLEDALFMTKPVLRVAVVIQNGSLEIISLVKGVRNEKRFLWKKLGTGCVRQV